MVYRRQFSNCAGNGDGCCVRHWVSEGAGRNRGESQRFDTMLISQADRLTMATGQRFSFIPISAAIDWAHGMDNVFACSCPPLVMTAFPAVRRPILFTISRHSVSIKGPPAL